MLPCYLHDDCKVLICTMSRRYTKWIALNYLNSLHEYINDVVFTGVVYWTSILENSSIIWDTRLHTVDLLVVDQAVQLTFFCCSTLRTWWVQWVQKSLYKSTLNRRVCWDLLIHCSIVLCSDEFDKIDMSVNCWVYMIVLDKRSLEVISIFDVFIIFVYFNTT